MIRRIRNIRWTLLAIAMIASTAFAGQLDWAPYVEYGVEHNSNIFSRSNSARGDTSQHASLGVLANWPISRQRFVLGAEVMRLRYNRFSRLDHSEHDARGAWQFEFGRAVYGSASYRDERYLDDFSNRASNQADFIRRRKPQVEGFVEIMPSWRMRARAARLSIDHSLTDSQRFDRRDNEGELALQYRGLPGSQYAVGGEMIDGTFPGRAANDPLARRFQQYTGFFDADWKYSGISRIRARFGYTARQNKDNSDGNRNFSGATGRLGYERTLTGKTKLYGEIFRQIYSTDNVDANYVRETGAQLETTWTYSPKLDVKAGISRSRRNYQTLAGGDSRRDTLDELTAKAVYQPRRALALIFNVGAAKRHSNRDSESYEGLVGGMALRVTLGYVPE